MILQTPSNKALQALQPSEKRYTVTVGSGLSLRVHPSGLKTWVLRQSFNGRVTDVVLGHFPETSLLAAQHKARQRLQANGKKPLRGYTFHDAFVLWCNLKKGRIVSYMDERRRLERYIIKPLGRRQIDEISAPLVIDTVKNIEKDGHKATLKRVLMRTREILDIAVCAGYIQHNPISRISKIFAPPKVTPMPAVKWQELGSVMEVLSKAPKRFQILFLFSLCSMLRPVENASLRKSWISGGVITIPAEHMKKRRIHRVPLTPLMAALITEAKTVSDHPRSDFVFPGRAKGTHISSQALAKFLHETELKGRLVAHGLRSIARSWMADHDVPFEVGEACLAHVSGPQASRSYLRSDYLDTRIQWMGRWSDFIAACAASAGILTEVIKKSVR